MRTLTPRASKGKAGRDRFSEPADVFEQPEHSLLGEALQRPIGFCAFVVLVVSAGIFIANYLHFNLGRINDFALVGFFVAGGLLLSTLLRAGDPAMGGRRKKHPKPEDMLEIEQDFDDDDDDVETLLQPIREQPSQRGLAEDAPVKAPRPSAAMPQSDYRPMTFEPADDDDDDEANTFQQALVHYANQGDFHGQGEVLRRLGHLAKSRGHLAESRGFFMNARSCFRKINDHHAEAAVLLDLGQVLESLEEHDAASAAYRDANRALLDVAMNTNEGYNAVQAHAAD